MNVKLLAIQFLFLLSVFAIGSEDALRYRVMLKDKGEIRISEKSPFLSAEAIERRASHGIEIDSADYPVSGEYLKCISDSGFNVVSQSRWMNTAVVSMSDSSRLGVLRAMPFVSSVKLVWINPISSKSIRRREFRRQKFLNDSTSIYGMADKQTGMLGLKPLHEAGFKGSGIRIAIIDAGFFGVDTMSWFAHTKIIAAKDFIYPPSSVYKGHPHGTSVLSLMAANKDYVLTGTAPDAEYCLLRSEDVATESPIEEDYWVAAVEFADSIGASIITCSLGYTEFDPGYESYTPKQLDGKTAFISKAAAIAVKKGLLVVCSAGNDGQKEWSKIGFPADVSGVLAVGSVSSDKIHSEFSSIGPTADGRIKPEVVALGLGTSIIDGNGQAVSGSGTSFSAPQITGMAACLWQAEPELGAPELIAKIEEGSDRAANPDTLYGYGIPNAYKIWLSEKSDVACSKAPEICCFCNPDTGILYLANFSGERNRVMCYVYDMMGERVLEDSFTGQSHTIDVSSLRPSLYLVRMVTDGMHFYNRKILICHR